ncbi:MAG TPA: hypothetical protein VL918_00740, partial [Sphingobium sp.]|nr:hypothetical protein [Sphingobium sp.]
EGPERIAPEWWLRQGGHAANPGRTRDYYRVEDADGHRFWLFRHGLYGAESGGPGPRGTALATLDSRFRGNDSMVLQQFPVWYVHGLFA